jgi:uncharacterized damage-inducible protein DinB
MPVDASALAEEWRETRRALLEFIEQIPETRAYRATDRAGWTLKHELSHLISLDAELVQLLGAAQQGMVEHIDAVALRRRRGQVMHAAQELRLTPLRERLTNAGEEAARAIEGATDALNAPLTVAGHEARTASDYIQAQIARARQGAEMLHRALG